MHALFQAKMIFFTQLFILISVFSFSQSNRSKFSDLIEEIRKTEKQFESDLNTMGADVAFGKYAASNAVIRRQNDSLILGPSAIRQFYSNENFKSAKAYWSPDYIDVSADGTLAYTYGKYKWISTDKSGKTQERHGIF
ncbi:MAG TPA: hypothetical protein VFV08_04045, partial [Puia sp.]|nr:hypothetical protein [Puia sp.]